MPSFFSKILASPAVRKAAFALVLAVLAALGVSLGSGCGGSIPPAVERAQALAECKLAALEAVVPREQAHALLREVQAKDVEAVARRLLGLGVTPERVREAADALRACHEPADAGAP